LKVTSSTGSSEGDEGVQDQRRMEPSEYETAVVVDEEEVEVDGVGLGEM
jgi:hypothetical protein